MHSAHVKQHKASSVFEAITLCKNDYFTVKVRNSLLAMYDKQALLRERK